MFRNDSVLCFYCHTQEERGNLRDQTNKDQVYISKGFSSWKKAPKCFLEHQNSCCHKVASSYQLVVPQWLDVGEMIDSRLIEQRKLERKYLLDVIHVWNTWVAKVLPFKDTLTTRTLHNFFIFLEQRTKISKIKSMANLVINTTTMKFKTSCFISWVLKYWGKS